MFVVHSLQLKKLKRKKSEIWSHYLEDPSDPNKVISKYCQIHYSHQSDGGLGHLTRHYELKHNRKQENLTDLR